MPSMTVHDSARKFASWAMAEGFFDGYGYANIADGESLDQITDDGRRILRQRQVTQVGFDSAEGKVIIYLRRAVPGKKLLEKLPASIDGFALEYVQGVEYPVDSNHTQPMGCPAWRIRQTAGQNFYTCGSSISVGNYMDSGTLGALVRGQSGQLYGLSNNHVCGSCNHADVGLPILAPGVFDVVAGGLDPFTIGYHAATLQMAPGSITIVNPADNHDAAIFLIRNESLVTSYQGDAYDTPSTTAPLVAGMKVEKVGRTTGRTGGVVQCQIAGPLPVSYVAQNYGFNGRVFYDPAFYICGETDIFSDNGDSGSLIVTTLPDGTRAAVGLVVGGGTSGSAPGGKISVVLPIMPVLERLNLTLVSGHNI
jgi:hypothetical protein